MALCQGRLERELREVFTRRCGVDGAIHRDELASVLEELGLFRGGEADDTFCTKLALLLDKRERGLIVIDDLLDFLAFAMDREGQERPRAASQTVAASLEEVCFTHLEQQLSRVAGRLLANRVCRPRASSAVAARRLRCRVCH